MYQVKCMYANAVIDCLGSRKTATQAKELIGAFEKRGYVHSRYGKPVEYWYQKADADIPDYIRRITERLLYA